MSLAPVATGCTSSAYLAGREMARLDGLTEGQTRTLETLDDGKVSVDIETEFTFHGVDAPPNLRFEWIRMEPPYLVGWSKEHGEVRINLSQVYKVEIQVTSAGKSVGAGAGIVAGIAAVVALVVVGIGLSVGGALKG